MELIKVSTKIIGNGEVNSVNARELWEVLEIKQQFADWIKQQINSLGLEENMDFLTFHIKVKRESCGLSSTLKEYIITTDAAKHISMASRTPKGKEVRSYFIEIEKQAKKGLVDGHHMLELLEENTSTLKEYNKAVLNLLQDLKQKESRATLSSSHLSEIRKRVAQIAGTFYPFPGENYEATKKQIFRAINEQMGACTYTEILKSQYGEVIEWLTSLQRYADEKTQQA